MGDCMDDMNLHDVEQLELDNLEFLDRKVCVQHVTICSRGGQKFVINLFSNKGVRKDENTHNDKH